MNSSIVSPLPADERAAHYVAQTGASTLTPAQTKRLRQKANRAEMVADPNRSHVLALYAGKRAAIRQRRRAVRLAGKQNIGSAVFQSIFRRAS